MDDNIKVTLKKKSYCDKCNSLLYEFEVSHNIKLYPSEVIRSEIRSEITDILKTSTFSRVYTLLAQVCLSLN